jgi:hypothetical protein
MQARSADRGRDAAQAIRLGTDAQRESTTGNARHRGVDVARNGGNDAADRRLGSACWRASEGALDSRDSRDERHMERGVSVRRPQALGARIAGGGSAHDPVRG